MLTENIVLATNAVMTGTTVVNSTPVQTCDMLYFSIQCIWASTPTGTFKVQACNDASTPTSSTTWTDLTNGTSVILNGTQPAGSAGSLIFSNPALGVPWNWIRLVYTNGSSTGTFSARLFSKGA